MRMDCQLNLRNNEHIIRLSVCNNNVQFYSKRRGHQSLLCQSIHVWNNISLNTRNCDSQKLFEGLYKEYLLTCQLSLILFRCNKWMYPFVVDVADLPMINVVELIVDYSWFNWS